MVQNCMFGCEPKRRYPNPQSIRSLFDNPLKYSFENHLCGTVTDAILGGRVKLQGQNVR